MQQTLIMKTEKKPISRLLEFIDYLIENKKVDSMADFERDCGLYYRSALNQISILNTIIEENKKEARKNK